MKNIVDPRSGKWLFPHHMIASVLYATWNDGNYYEHLNKLKSEVAPAYWEELSKDDRRIRVCEEKAEELFEKIYK